MMKKFFNKIDFDPYKFVKSLFVSDSMIFVNISNIDQVE